MIIQYGDQNAVMSQPRLVQVLGLASTRRPCPRRSRLGTSSHPLHPRQSLRCTIASIVWNCVLCASLDTALGLDRRKVHVLRRTPRTSTADSTLKAIYVRICAYMRICVWDARVALHIALAHSRLELGQFGHPPVAPYQTKCIVTSKNLPCVTCCTLVHNE